MKRAESIQRLIDLELERGNKVTGTDTGWSKPGIVWQMSKPISQDGRYLAESFGLEYYKAQPGTHVRVGELFCFKAQCVEFPTDKVIQNAH